MVKNTQGGKHKNQARKDTYVRKTVTRLSMDECEKYAIVDKLYGGGRCKVITVDNLELMCTIRGKFTGKFKRSNTVTAGAFVLVGLREWESSPVNCDLIEIYDNSDMTTLTTIPSVAAFLSSSNSSNSDVVFDNKTFILPALDVNHDNHEDADADADLDFLLI
jgi:translation initiation factor IF-1